MESTLAPVLRLAPRPTPSLHPLKPFVIGASGTSVAKLVTTSATHNLPPLAKRQTKNPRSSSTVCCLTEVCYFCHLPTSSQPCSLHRCRTRVGFYWTYSKAIDLHPSVHAVIVHTRTNDIMSRQSAKAAPGQQVTMLHSRVREKAV